MKNFILLITLLIIIPQKAAGQNNESAIKAIENGLLLNIILENDTSPGKNILERMEYYKVPAVSIAVLNEGEIEWAKAYGVSDEARKIPVDEHTIFQAASISKPVAAMAALAFVEEGKLGLNDNVNDYLKDWQVKDNKYTKKEKVTLRRILSHTAGLTVHGFRGYDKSEKVPTTVQVLDGSKPANSDRIFPNIIPGTQYRYSGGGYTVMQKMLCDISEKEFPLIMDEYVLSKIGMDASTYKQPLPEELDKKAAYGHRSDGNLVPGNWHTYPEMAAAGLWTTPTDLLKYAMEVQLSYEGKSNKILSQKMTADMLTAQLNSHGIGPGVGGDGEYISFSHGGANEGFQCLLFAYTKKGQGVAVMTNSDNGIALAREIIRGISNYYDWPDYKPNVEKALSLNLEDMEIFEGSYLHKRAGQDMLVDITVGKEGLKCVQQWDSFSYEVFPVSETEFINPNDDFKFEFTFDEDGSVNKMIVREYSTEFIFKKQ